MRTIPALDRVRLADRLARTFTAIIRRLGSGPASSASLGGAGREKMRSRAHRATTKASHQPAGETTELANRTCPHGHGLVAAGDPVTDHRGHRTQHRSTARTISPRTRPHPPS